MQIKAYWWKPEEMLTANLRNMTTRELIKYCGDSDDPIVVELKSRLELCLDFVTKQAGL